MSSIQKALAQLECAQRMLIQPDSNFQDNGLLSFFAEFHHYGMGVPKT
jgi:hypothetical protein